MSALRSLIILGLLMVAAILVAVTGEGDAEPPQARPDAPNVIVIMTDDQALNTWNREIMPRTFERIVDRGTLFENGFAVPPLCCPARATLMTGRYPQNHGVTTNRYNALADPVDVLPVWLSEAGYETMMAGKFLNGYENAAASDGGILPAPGWDRWWVATGEERKYFDYDVSVDGNLVPYGSERGDYVTNAITEAATEFIVAEAGGDSPYFLWMAHAAPHQASRDRNPRCRNKGPVPLPGDFRAARDARLPIDVSFSEEDVSDKPDVISRYPRLSASAVAREELKYRCTVAALQPVDRSVEEIFETLEQTGEGNTLVFFLSDNGTYFGEHRKPGGKELAYDPSAKIPFAAKLPGEVSTGARRSQLMVGIHDIAPTILELAGLEGEYRTDGRSLVGPLSGSQAGWPEDRALVLEVGNADKCVGYRALRTPSYLFVENRELEDEGCAVGFKELYDLREDPFMLENRLALPQEVQRGDELKAAELAERLARLNTCSGIDGRDAPSAVPYCE